MKRILISVLSVALLAGCGSSGGGSSSDSSGNGGSNAGPGNPPPANNQISGCFVDNPVAGLSYRSGNGSGLTSAEGCYTAAGTIDFLIGDILLGSAAVGDFITPVDLVPGAGNEADPAANARVTNLSRLLQTLDAAANTANGIQLSEQARAAGTGRALNFDQSIEDFEQDPAVQAFLAAAGAPALVPAGQAQAHLQNARAH